MTKKFALGVLSLGVLALPGIAGAVDLPGLKIDLVEGSFNIWTVINNLINFILLVAGIAAFFYVLYGGFVYLTAGGDSAKTGQARTIITNALIGIIIIALSYVLVNFVVRVVNSDFDIESTQQRVR